MSLRNHYPPQDAWHKPGRNDTPKDAPIAFIGLDKPILESFRDDSYAADEAESC